MSIKNLPYNQNKLILENFEAHNAFTIKENINAITHQVDESTGEYVIKNANNNKVLSVNLDGTLTQPSYIKSHISSVVAPVSSQVGIHQTKLNEHETKLNEHDDRLSVVENNVGTNDLTSLENRIDDLEAYIVKLKTFMNNFKAGLSNYGSCNFDDVIN